MTEKQKLQTVYDALYHTWGPQHWWPAETPFEVMVGAVLTQNTSWGNVEKAIARLRAMGGLSANTISVMAGARLAEVLRPVGYFNLKARRLQNFCAWYLSSGGFEVQRSMETGELRSQLLSINGVGPETADDILLYAYERPVFVIDAYTRRLFSRLGLIQGDEGYEILRAHFESRLPPDPVLYGEYHALIVRHSKELCFGQGRPYIAEHRTCGSGFGQGRPYIAEHIRTGRYGSRAMQEQLPRKCGSDKRRHPRCSHCALSDGCPSELFFQPDVQPNRVP